MTIHALIIQAQHFLWAQERFLTQIERSEKCPKRAINAWDGDEKQRDKVRARLPTCLYAKLYLFTNLKKMFGLEGILSRELCD